MLVVSFAMSDTMFPESCTIDREPISSDVAIRMIRDYSELSRLLSALNPSHARTIEAIRVRFGIELPIPEQAPKIKLEDGDKLLVIAIQGLPRLGEGEVYSNEQIGSANFKFGLWTVGL